jgi:hypothetical protein
LCRCDCIFFQARGLSDSILLLLFHSFFLFRRVALHKYDPPDLVTSVMPAVVMSQLHTDENIVNKTPIRCVSTGKQPPQDSSHLSPTMDDTTPISIPRSSPHSTWFDDVDGHTDNAARNLDFDDMLDVDADDALGAIDPDDSDDDLI